MPPFVACPSCEQHAKVSETSCPHCGAALRDAGGSIRRTATAAVLGLAAVTSTTDCKVLEPVDEYGPAPTRDHEPVATATGATASATAAASATATPSATVTASAGATATAAPGPGSAVPEYGPPPTMHE